MGIHVGSREWVRARSVSRVQGVKKSVYQRHQLEDSDSSLCVWALGWLHLVNEGQVMRFRALSSNISADSRGSLYFVSLVCLWNSYQQRLDRLFDG